MTLAPSKLITVEEFDNIVIQPENDGRKLQLINGEIIEEMPKIIHSRIALRLIDWLLNYFKAHPIGEILPEIRVDLPDDLLNARVPDIGVVVNREADLAKLDAHDSLPFMPDLIIEIQSQGQSDRFMSDLANHYLSNGCRMVWLIYADRKLVEWLTPTERQLLTIDDTISGGAVLPEFSLPVEKIFAAE